MYLHYPNFVDVNLLSFIKNLLHAGQSLGFLNIVSNMAVDGQGPPTDMD